LATRGKGNRPVENKSSMDIDRVDKRLDMLDQRLDNIDSIMTSLVERIMQQPVIFEVTCPNCGHPIQINIMSTVRMKG
jgi:3-dehydroquinate dehydratase